ncbi:GDSL-type esterase/lipase family protein [Chitinophaga sedimenti]|uniref:GDSL-type esterase/lipase family protein n=1 Tax=Chitinophaga sedimenti TaxID=2033606 RepID=UPI0020047BF2|nr:GDSL-type esterase/lipase family protein [Chitinophaga sedimenti]MCK7558376.1 GDSL-type esterase/lipase family protein [Chitinophaga sedimenti]
MKYTFTALALLAGSAAMAQQAEKKIDSSYANTYYQGRMEIFRTLPMQKGTIVFLGNSITERAQWNELLPGKAIVNRGIGGDNSFGVLARLDTILLSKPSKIFPDIGINDIGRGLPVTVIANNYERILRRVKELSPKTKVFAQSVLPMNDAVLKAEYLKNKKAIIVELNVHIKKLAVQYGATYVDLHNDVFADTNGDLKQPLTVDGIHLAPKAYVLWVDYLKSKKYI